MDGENPQKRAKWSKSLAVRILAWCFYDWANSSFPTVIGTFVFATYFTEVVASDTVYGTELWGYALSASALSVALLSPVLGAIADRIGSRKPWIAFFTLICAVASLSLWFVKPDGQWALYAAVAFALGSLGFELGMVFYNAMLPDLVPDRLLGRTSGWAWACGYAGGLVCLGIALFVFVRPEPALFSMNKETFEHIRITGPFVAVWIFVFTWPLLLLVPDRPRSNMALRKAAREGLKTLAKTFREVKKYKNIFHYLIARMVYTDGVNTLFAFGGIYAAGTFGFDWEDILIFGISLNIAAGLGAMAFAWIDDYIGSKPTVVISLLGLIGLGTLILLVEDKTIFYISAIILGLFVGPVQSASRSLMARMSPPNMRAEMFGLYALSGKATAFIGPALVGFITAASGSQRWGMSVIVAMLCIGLIMLIPVNVIIRNPKADGMPTLT